MLSLGSAAESITGLPPAGLVLFPDHRDSRVLHYLPAEVGLATEPSGEPDFLLLRYRGDSSGAGGGLLRWRLELAAPPPFWSAAAEAAGWRPRAVAFDEGRFRFRLRSLVEAARDEAGDWHSITPAGQEIAATSVGLTPRETQFLQLLLEAGGSVVEVELELSYRGLVLGIPWLGTAQTAALKTHLAASLPPAAVREDEVVAAFLSLPDADGEMLAWRRLEPDAPEPAGDVLRTEVALRSLESHRSGVLFAPEPRDEVFEPPRYRLLPPSVDDPPTVSWDLIPPRQEQRYHSLGWSVTQIYDQLTDPEARQRFFPTVTQVSPFAVVDVRVINRVPMDHDYLRQVTVDLRYSGPSGVPEFRSVTFDGRTDVARFRTVYPAWTSAFQLDYRLTATLAPSNGVGWPTVRRGEYEPSDGVVVEVERRALGMDFVEIGADAAVFETAAAIEVAVVTSAVAETEQQSLAELTLTAAKPAAWVALPDVDPATVLGVRATARSRGDPATAYVVRDGTILGRRVRITADELEVLEPDRVSIDLDPEVAELFALVLVRIAPLDGDEKYFSLTPGEPKLWNLFRGSVFEPVRFRYRLDYIAYDSEGHTLPLATTDWTIAEGTSLLVRPPAVGQEVPQ